MEDEIRYPSHFESVTSQVTNIFAFYGWYILIFLIVALYLYDKYLRSGILKYRIKKDELEYAAKYHKNPDLLSNRLLAQEERVKYLQERYKKAAEEHKRQEEEKELKKREEILKKYGNSGYKLGPGTSKSFKPEYNPLMGSGSSSNYKPPKKSACSGGGCGK